MKPKSVVFLSQNIGSHKFAIRPMGKKVSSKFKKKVKVYCKDLIPFPENIDKLKTGVIYDPRTEKNPSFSTQNGELKHNDNPKRTRKIMDQFLKTKILDHDVNLVNKVDLLSIEKAIQVYGKDYVEFLQKMRPEENKNSQPKTKNSNPSFDSFEATRRSAESARLAVENVVKGRWKNAFALCRSSENRTRKNTRNNQFWSMNNAVIGAHEAIHDLGLKKVLILDWNVRHGDSTQSLTYSDNRILYMSIHRFDKEYFSSGSSGGVENVGESQGKGFNLNFPYSFDSKQDQSMDDYMYNYAFERGFWPVISEFEPELVIISFDFNCVHGDPFGRIHVNGDCKSSSEGINLTNWFGQHARENPETHHIASCVSLGRRLQLGNSGSGRRVHFALSQRRISAQSGVSFANVQFGDFCVFDEGARVLGPGDRRKCESLGGPLALFDG